MAELERDTEPQESIDAIGLKCPEPVMLLHAAMRRLAPGQELTLRATDPSTERDVPNFCEFLGHALLILAERATSFYIASARLSVKRLFNVVRRSTRCTSIDVPV